MWCILKTNYGALLLVYNIRRIPKIVSFEIKFLLFDLHIPNVNRSIYYDLIIDIKDIFEYYVSSIFVCTVI